MCSAAEKPLALHPLAGFLETSLRGLLFGWPRPPTALLYHPSVLLAPMFLQSFCLAGYVFAILQLALPTIVEQWQLLHGLGDERRDVKSTGVHYDSLPCLYFLHDAICDFSGTPVLFVGQMSGHFGWPYCTPTLFANHHLPFGQMHKKIICALHRCWNFAVNFFFCFIRAILVCIVTQTMSLLLGFTPLNAAWRLLILVGFSCRWL
jgi:hypothetical protein